MHKNLEKVLFDTAESTWNNSNLQKNTRSPSNLSLLNKVEMESTYNDTVHNTMLLGQNFEYEEEEEDDADFNSESSSQTQQQAKIVQFGNTIHHRYMTNSTSNQPTTTTSQATSTPTNSSNSKNNEMNEMLNDTKSNQYEEDESDDNDEYASKNRNIFLEQNQKNPYDDDFHSSLDSSLTSSTKHSTSTSNFFTAAMSKNQMNESPRSSKSSPRLSPRRYLPKDEQPAISENDEEYDEIEYLGQTNQNTNQSLKTSSKYSISNDYHSDYNMKSFIDDSHSLSLSKVTNGSFR